MSLKELKATFNDETLGIGNKRLESLEHVRPAYMDEYEQLEKELEVRSSTSGTSCG